MGNLGKTPELRYFNDGTPTTTISIAYSEKWKDTKSGEQKEYTEWFTAVLYHKQAELVCQYMHKGDCIQVHGKNLILAVCTFDLKSQIDFFELAPKCFFRA